VPVVDIPRFSLVAPMLENVICRMITMWHLRITWCECSILLKTATLESAGNVKILIFQDIFSEGLLIVGNSLGH
jgi:hypothetical protein